MNTRHDVFIAAPPEAVFAAAADVESWPALHPAYRRCRILERAPGRILFEMAGIIRGWPARWTAVQEQDPVRRITFHHIHGITAGMTVEWTLEAAAAGTQVALVHDLVMRWPLVGRAVSDLIVGPIFIDWIAHQTLLAVKAAAESPVKPLRSEPPTQWR